MSDERRELVKLRIGLTFTQVVLARLVKHLGHVEEMDEYLERLKDDFVTDYIASSVGGGDWPSKGGMHDEAVACIETFRQLLKESSSR